MTGLPWFRRSFPYRCPAISNKLLLFPILFFSNIFIAFLGFPFFSFHFFWFNRTHFVPINVIQFVQRLFDTSINHWNLRMFRTVSISFDVLNDFFSLLSWWPLQKKKCLYYIKDRSERRRFLQQKKRFNHTQSSPCDE